MALVHTFSRWTEAFSARTETAAEVAKILLKIIIFRFGCPGSLQSNKDPAFVSQVTKGIMSALDRKCREGHGTPLQYSCLENPMDGGAW